MKTCIKHIILLCLSILPVASNLYGQGVYPPLLVDSVENTSVYPFPGRDYYHYGYDSISKHSKRVPSDAVGRDYDARLPREAREARERIDSVTVGSQMKYFVLPDPDVNFRWYNLDTTIINTHDTLLLDARFIWKASHSGAAAGLNRDSLYHPVLPINSADQKSPFHIVKWNRLSDADPDTLYVYEEAGAAFGYGFQADTTAMPVRVINKPSVSFVDTADAVAIPYLRMLCLNVAPSAAAPASYYFKYTVKSDVAGQKYQKVTYTVSKNGAPLLSPPAVSVPENGIDSILLTVTDFGTYRVEILDVSDRISRKSTVSGSPLTEPSPFPPASSKARSSVFTIVVAPPPQLNAPAYRVPNRRK
ncbi:hypothetical protein FACS189430_02690 [Bacteroidia bacterium]|nr:hypothetical protein FACS189430_02690 [Bacteroidia bacterium]